MDRDQVSRTLGSRFTKKDKTREELLKEIINHLEKLDRAERIDENKIRELRQKYDKQLFDAAVTEVKNKQREDQQKQAQKSALHKTWELTLNQNGYLPRQSKVVELVEAQLNTLRKISKGQNIDKNEIQTLQQKYGVEAVNKAISKLEQRFRQDQQQQAQKSPKEQTWNLISKERGNTPREANIIELLKEELNHSERMNKSTRIAQNTQQVLERNHGSEMFARAQHLCESLFLSDEEKKSTGRDNALGAPRTRKGIDQQAWNDCLVGASSSQHLSSSISERQREEENSRQTAADDLLNDINDESKDDSVMNQYYQQS